jgi:hypothetical protein
MKKVLFSVFLVLNAMALDLRASLLATFDSVGWGFGAGDASWYPVPVEYQFVLGYGIPETAGIVPFDIVIGTGGAVGSTLTGYEFTAANSPAFDALADKITDSTSETLYGGMYLFSTSGTIVSGIGLGNTDTDLFGTPTDWAIDNITLVVNNSSLTSSITEGIYRVDYTFDLTWEIWGSGTPIGPTNVPDTGSTLGLMAVSLFRPS